MRITMRRLQALMLSVLIALVPLTSLAPAQQSEKQRDEKPAGPNLLRQLIKRVEKLEGELKRLKSQQGVIPADEKDRKIITLLETTYLGANQYGSNRTKRFFATRLIFVNMTAQAVTIKRDDVVLKVDGKNHPLKDVPRQLQYRSFQVGRQTFQLRKIEKLKSLRLPSGGTGGAWIVFTDLPQGNNIPKLVLNIKIGAKQSKIDVNEFCARTLGLSVEQIGPRGSLALLTISGEMNTINAGHLVDKLDELIQKKIARAVVRWSESAAPLDTGLHNWLQQAATQTGTSSAASALFPTIPATIREFHLSKVPFRDSRGSKPRLPQQAIGRVHDNDLDAVKAALRSAYEAIPRSELLKEIEHGNPLTRAAALAAGGGRLPDAQLPVILRYADSDDVQMQKAALTALQHFGDRRAIDKLLEYTRKNAQPLAKIAVESLAASRFSAAHTALLGVLKNETRASKKTIVKVLARYPRPIWSETIYEFARDPNSEITIDALGALVEVGHPKLIEVFRHLLEKGNSTLKMKTFDLLAARTDSASEELALEFTLKYLKKSTPTPVMARLLNRTKDSRAVPLLLKHLEKPSGNRTTVISSLAQIGDQTVAKVFVKKYSSLRDNEKTLVLSALRQMKSPEFLRLATEALMSRNHSLINAACQGLQADAGPEAVRALIKAFENSSNQQTWSLTSRALGVLGTPEAKTALKKARDSSDKRKRQYAVNSLRRIRQRSPGIQLVYRGRQSAAEKKWKEAIDYYTQSLKLDPELPEAYAGRANALMMQGKHAVAKKDFSKAVKLDPFDAQAVTGLGVCLAVEGKSEEAVKTVEDARKRLTNNQTLAYNIACVYGRAYEFVKKNEKEPNREQKLTQYRRKAIDELKRSVKLGMKDFKWMTEDPDLMSLHGDPEFEKIDTRSDAEKKRQKEKLEKEKQKKAKKKTKSKKTKKDTKKKGAK